MSTERILAPHPNGHTLAAQKQERIGCRSWGHVQPSLAVLLGQRNE
jgi:hypothetical protein